MLKLYRTSNLVKYLAPLELGNQFWDEQEWVFSLHCHCIQCLVVLYELEGTTLLFDKEDWRSHWGFGGMDVARVKVLLEELVKFFLL